ncbi:MAG: sporulation protein YabP [Clostridia bacterium]|nr:sporulation protein YabP [Clostridia bacterium]
MDNRRAAALTGISEVIAFDDNQVILSTDQGDVALTGEGLHVTRLMLEEGQLTVEGRIDSVFYSQRKRRRGLFRRRDP